ncbi:MAG: ORF6N domain-containing protein [Thermoplasmatota archaeon]
MTSKSLSNLKSQFATSSWGGRRTNPYAFTEEGVAMLSAVLKSRIAVEMNSFQRIASSPWMLGSLKGRTHLRSDS